MAVGGLALFAYVLGCVAVAVPLVIRVDRAKRARAITEQTYWRVWTIVCLALAWPVTFAVALLDRPRDGVANAWWRFVVTEASRPRFAAITLIGVIVGLLSGIVTGSATWAVATGVIAGGAIALIVMPEQRPSGR